MIPRDVEEEEEEEKEKVAMAEYSKVDSHSAYRFSSQLVVSIREDLGYRRSEPVESASALVGCRRACK